MGLPRVIVFAVTASAITLYLAYTLKLHLILFSPTSVDALNRLLQPQFWPTSRSASGDDDDASGAQSLYELVHSYKGARTPFTRHIVAVGDLHGDLPNARRVLRFSDVVDEFDDWSGSVDVFVQTGDIIDRGDDTIALFAWMDRLRAQADAVGSTVLSNLGNHEWMNMIGDWRYVYPSEIKTFGSVEARQDMLNSGDIGRTWAINYTTATRLPLHPALGPPNTPYPPPSSSKSEEREEHLHYARDTEELDLELALDAEHHLRLFHGHRERASTNPLSHAAISFVHGGLSPTYRELAPFPTKINDIAASLLRKLQERKPQPPPHPPNAYPGLPASATDEERRLYDANGPLWYRGWALADEEQVCKDVDHVLAQTGTRRMVMGHTPDFDNIVSRCGGKIIIIDTGISHAYGGVLSALSIHYTLQPIGDDAEQRWVERETVSALYSDQQTVLAEEEREVVGDFQIV